MVLDYGTPESLEILKAHAHELAAVWSSPCRVATQFAAGRIPQGSQATDRAWERR